MTNTYDFIVVGSGPAGAAVARRRADSTKAPSVLLLEAGGLDAEPESRLLADRFNIFLTFPQYNWGYQTTPQTEFNDRALDFSRGKGLGGSSSINFLFWTTGPKDDYDEWTKRVGDESFNWDNALRRYKNIEAYNSISSSGVKHYVNPSPDHGKDGALGVEYPPELENYLLTTVKASLDSGLKWNDDYNSGNPATSVDAYLRNAPANLTIKTDSQAIKVLVEAGKATGVVTTGGTYYAQKDVILSGDAIDTPKLLLLSGIGPKQEPSQHGIETVVDHPYVGKNMEDHIMVLQSVELKKGVNAKNYLVADPQKLKEAKEQFLKDGTGPPASFYGTVMVVFSKPDPSILESEEYKSLSEEAQEHLKLSKSRGTVTLRSSNPSDPPICDPQYLKHPFDRKVLIDAMRRNFKLITHPLVAVDTLAPAVLPSGLSDEEIWGYIQVVANSVYHMSYTAKMGRADDPEAVVTSDFKLKGVNGLRIADMSVAPFVPKTHTQSTAYFIGETAAEKIIQEYGLDA